MFVRRMRNAVLPEAGSMVYCRDDSQVIRDEPVLYKSRPLKPQSRYRGSAVQMLDTLLVHPSSPRRIPLLVSS